MAKPGLAILIGKAMDKNKDKMPMMGKDSYAADEEEADDKYDSEAEMDEQLHDIAEELIDAINAKDADAVADLLKEAFDCMS